jgi:hypothetical protein
MDAGTGEMMQVDQQKRQILSPGKTVRAVCRGCIGAERFNDEIKNCSDSDCAFHLYRNGQRVSVKILRRYCLQCTNGSRAYIQNCPTYCCPVWPYRMGKNPNRIGKGHFAIRTVHRKVVK